MTQFVHQIRHTVYAGFTHGQITTERRHYRLIYYYGTEASHIAIPNNLEYANKNAHKEENKIDAYSGTCTGE